MPKVYTSVFKAIFCNRTIAFNFTFDRGVFCIFSGMKSEENFEKKNEILSQREYIRDENEDKGNSSLTFSLKR